MDSDEELDADEDLLLAAKDGDNAVAEIAAALDLGANIEAIGDVGMRALHFASKRGHREVVALLLDRGSNIEALAYSQWTPILYASTNGHFEVVQLLHARGGGIHHVDVNGVNALHMASRKDHLPVCLFLLSKGAHLMTATKIGSNALIDYGKNAEPPLSPEIKALRVAALVAASEAFWSEKDTAQCVTIEAQSRAIAEAKNDFTLLEKAAQTNPSLLFSDAFSDLVFVCPGGERIHAHRNIVSTCSPKARALLQGQWAENKDERVTVVQMPQSAGAVRALLASMYTGEVDAAGVKASMSDVLELASQHDQPALKAACELHAIACLSVATVVPVLVTAHLHDLQALKAACVDLIKVGSRNTALVMDSRSFKGLKTKHPQLWLEMRAALELPEEEKEDEGEEDEGQDNKRARHEN